MNIKRAKQEITDTIEAYLLKDEDGMYVIPKIRQRPVLLLGAPGIGKTQIMEQIARECGIGLVAYTITHHTRQSAIGLPFVSKETFGGREYTVTEYTMSEIVASVYEKMEKTGLKEGILFIDEINCASETLAPAMLQFLQCKTFGSHEIPDGWIIVAAGNPPEYNKSVREFDVVTMDRVKKIEVEPDFAVWKEYAIRQQLHPAVISYLNARTGNFYRMETTVDGRKFATPRGWEDLSQMLIVYEQLGKEMNREVVVQYLQHEEVAKDFANYLELYRKYQMDYQLDEVLAGTIDPILLKKVAHASFDERLSVVGLLLARCRSTFAAQMREEQVTLLVFDALKQIKEGMLETHPDQPLLAMEETLDALRADTAHQKQAELLTRAQEKLRLSAEHTLEEYQQKLQTADASDGIAAFALLRGWFDSRQDDQDEQQQAAGAMLEHAFDFMEAAFGSGQEMVIFVTELNCDYYSVKFLQEYECERYFYYNKELLFDEGRSAIEKRLQNLGK
jgi:hypothetical protein